MPKEWKGGRTLETFRRSFKWGHPSTGNVSGGGQLSSFIRGRFEQACNGQINTPGHLRDFDLKPFKDNGFLPNQVEQTVLDWTDGAKNACLYAFYCRNADKTYHGTTSPKRFVPVAFVLTTGDHKYIAHWAAKSDHRYETTADWLATQLGWTGEAQKPAPDEIAEAFQTLDLEKLDLGGDSTPIEICRAIV